MAVLKCLHGHRLPWRVILPHHELKLSAIDISKNDLDMTEFVSVVFSDDEVQSGVK